MNQMVMSDLCVVLLSVFICNYSEGMWTAKFCKNRHKIEKTSLSKLTWIFIRYTYIPHS